MRRFTAVQQSDDSGHNGSHSYGSAPSSLSLSTTTTATVTSSLRKSRLRRKRNKLASTSLSPSSMFSILSSKHAILLSAFLLCSVLTCFVLYIFLDTLSALILNNNNNNNSSSSSKSKNNSDNNINSRTTRNRLRSIARPLTTNSINAQQPSSHTTYRGKQFPPPFPVITRNNNNNNTLSQAALDMCTNTLWHTLETTTIVLPDAETFIHTGDIDDLWLRDSAAQIHPLLVPFFQSNNNNNNNHNYQSLFQQDSKLQRIVSGLIKRTAMYIRHDPYANAFRIDDSYVFSAQQKLLGRHDLISTWNYELDSACYYIRLLYFYWNQADDLTVLKKLPQVQQAVQIMVDLWKAEQQHELDQYPTGELFDCLNCNKPYRYPGLPRDGKGTPTNASTGMTWTGFRPSDDECLYGFLVPANMFAVVALEYVVEMAQKLWNNKKLAQKAQQLANEIQQGIQQHATVEHPKYGTIYAYEVDGLGHANLMDDANIPSLLSIPYLGYKYYDADIYANTRRFILSPDNPTYRSGTNRLTGPVEGYGSPHMAARIRDNIWPMSIAMQALTSTDLEEKIHLIETLVKASAGTGWMHESFDVHDPHHFTRSWFCWSDSLFAELVLSVTDECPNPAHKYKVMDWRDPVQVPGGVYAAND